jgi:hypothetical protein
VPHSTGSEGGGVSGFDCNIKYIDYKVEIMLLLLSMG